MTTLASHFEGPLMHAYASLAAECWWALDGHQLTVATGRFLASCLVNLAPGHRELGTQRLHNLSHDY
jgi:hypothetical protein